MNEPTSRFWKIFFEVYQSLPRQGPGFRACATRALGLCRDLPPSPAVLDLGCGVGGRTLQLAELTAGSIVAIDSHAPSIERLRATVAERGLSERRIAELRGKYAGDPEALGALDQLAHEPDLHRRYSDHYAYEFFVVHRPTRGAER